MCVQAKGDTAANYSTTGPNYGNSDDRFFPYQRTTANEQIQFAYSTSNRASQYPHITYSTSIQIPPVSNLTYAQSHMNETSIYNQIHSHHYHNVHQATAHSAPSLAPQTIQQQISQTNATTTNLPAGGQQPNQEQLHHPVYHHVPNLNAHHNYSLLQGTYPADYMLAHHTHQLHHTNNQQLTQNSLYYPTPAAAAANLTQLSAQVQSTNGNVRNSTAVENNLYTNHLSLVKSTVNSLSEPATKSDENNNLENNSTNALDVTNQMSSVLENT